MLKQRVDRAFALQLEIDRLERLLEGPSIGAARVLLEQKLSVARGKMAAISWKLGSLGEQKLTTMVELARGGARIR